MKRITFALSLLLSMDVYAAEVADSVSMQEVVVTGTRSEVDSRYLPYNVTMVNRQQLTEGYRPSVLPTLNEQVPGLFIPSRGMMGYGVNSGGAGGIFLRGISSGTGQVLVLIDGQPQYNGIYGHSIADLYQSHIAERVEVLTGPASMIYGSNAMGGVINIVTRQVRRDTVLTNLNVGAGSYGTVQTEATNQVRRGKFSSTVSAQYNRSDNHRENMDFQQVGGFAKLGYEFTSHWNASADVDINHFYTELPGTVAAPMFSNEQWITRGSAALAVENRYGGKMPTNGAIRLYSNFGQHKIDDGTANPASPTTQYFRSRDNLSGLSLYQTVGFYKGNSTTFGFDYQHIYGRAYYTDKATGNEMPPSMASGKSHRNEVAGYVDFRQDIANWLTIDAGMRVDYHSVAGTELIPQGGIVVRPMKEGEIKATVSKGFRNPTMRELYLYKPANADLSPEKLMNYELSWNHHLLSGRLNYGVNVFYLKGENIIQPQMVNGAMLNVNVGEVENCGLEVKADYSIKEHWNLATNHSYLHMKKAILSAPVYKGYLGAQYSEKRWTASGGLQYLAGLYTSVGATETKENYCLLTASVSHRVWRSLSLWLRGETVLAGRDSYETILGYPMPHATLMAGFNWDF